MLHHTSCGDPRYKQGYMGQPSLILEYNLGGEGDLFKAPEPIIEESPAPLLGLEPAFSMMSGSGSESDAINMGLIEVLYECEKELMEKSVMEETISMLHVAEEVPAGELHKSVSSGCPTSTDWMKGTSPVMVRPNFLDFQELDLEAAFGGLTTAYSEGDIQGHRRQLSLISEYDLGGEVNLFQAPEPIIEEPPLRGLDPALSMMSGSGGENGAINVGLIEVLYECEAELMEKSVIEDTISELLDVEISKLLVEEEVHAGELYKSVSSGRPNSIDWMNGTSSVRVRPNFLDFQELDLAAEFGRLRTACSEGDTQNLGANTPRPGNSGNVHTYCERLMTPRDLKTEERKQKLCRYRKKKIKRNFGRKIEYACRKAMADSQPRVRGRFAKMVDGNILKLRRK